MNEFFRNAAEYIQKRNTRESVRYVRCRTWILHYFVWVYEVFLHIFLMTMWCSAFLFVHSYTLRLRSIYTLWLICATREYLPFNITETSYIINSYNSRVGNVLRIASTHHSTAIFGMKNEKNVANPPVFPYPISALLEY